MDLENNNQAWWCYLVECVDGSFYCGVTNDLPRRLQQHNGSLQGGAKYTAARRPVTLQASWSHPNRSSASKQEYQIKQLIRQQKEGLIEEFKQTAFSG